MKHIDLEQLRVDAQTMNRAQMAEKHGVCVATISAQIAKLGIRLPRAIRPGVAKPVRSREVAAALQDIGAASRARRADLGPRPNGRV